MSFQPYYDHSDHDVSPTSTPKRREVRPSTPSRQMSNPILRQSSSPRTKTGLVFGTPRKGKSDRGSPLEDPFADQVSPTSVPEVQKSGGLKRLALPARTITYPRANEKATYGRPEGYSDDEYTSPSGAHYLDDKEAMLMAEEEEDDEEASMISETPLDVKQKRSKLRPLQTVRKWLTPSSTAKRPHRLWLYWSSAVVVLLLSGLIACVLLITVGFRHPEAHWKGTLSLSNDGALDATGFNFTRHVQIGVTNPNLWAVDLSSLELSATFNATFPFATGSATDLKGISIPRRNAQNATIPVEMSFAYATAQDAGASVLKQIYLACRTGAQVPLAFEVRGQVKSVFGLPSRKVGMGSVAGGLECGSRLVSLLQNMLYLRGEDHFLSSNNLAQ